MNKITTKSWWLDLLLITVLFSILYGAFLGSRPLAVPDEARYTEIPREMLVSGDYVTPRLDGFIYFEKPALFYWLQTIPLKIFGINEWSARLITVLMGLLGCLMIYFVTRKLFDRRTAWFATLILASSPLYYAMSHMITIDMTLSVFLCASLFSFLLGTREAPGRQRNYYMWGMYLFAALALLTKGLIGIVFPGLIIFVWVLFFNQWKELKTYCIPTGILLILLIAAPWHILVQLKNPVFFDYYFIKQQFTRYATDYAGRKEPMWFLPTVLIVGLMPWIGFLIQSIKTKLYANGRNDKTFIFLLLWVMIIFVFFWFSRSQLIPYILPIFPPLAVLIASYFSAHIGKPSNSNLTIGFIIAASLLLLLCVTCIVAPQIINVISKQAAYIHLIPTALFFAIGAISSLICYWRKKLTLALCLIALNMIFAFANLSNAYPSFSYNSTKPLTLQLKPLLKPTDIVVSYNYYYQDIPVYLQRLVAVTNNFGELQFGLEQPYTQGLHLSETQLWKTWHTPQRVYMILDKKLANDLRQNPQTQFFLLGETPGDVLITNHPVKP